MHLFTQLGSHLLLQQCQGQLHSLAPGVDFVADYLVRGNPLPTALLSPLMYYQIG